jgi:hypothetical protein
MRRQEAERFATEWADTVTRGGRFTELVAPGVDPTPFEERADTLRRRLGPLVVSVDEVVCEGDRVAWRWTLRAGSTTVTGVNFQRLADRRLLEHWTLAGPAS